MAYKKIHNMVPHRCVECGTAFYGRTDKRFCTDKCRCQHFRKTAGDDHLERRPQMEVLKSNYKILSGLLQMGITSIPTVGLTAAGYDLNFCTFCKRERGGHELRRCFDIEWSQTGGKLFGLRWLDSENGD